MNFGFLKSHLYSKFWDPIFFAFTLLFISLVSGVHAESKEIFLPFPETWNESLPKESDKLDPSKPTTGDLKDTKVETLTVSEPPPKTDLNLTSSKTDSKKKKKKEVIDPSKASYQKGKAYLSRDQKKSAEQEFADSYGKEGEVAKFSRVENTNLFGLDGKEKESSGLVEKQEDPDLKIKSQFELARSLDRIGNPESEEKAYKEYLKLVTEFPKHPELTPRAHYAMAVLLIRKKEYRSAAHQLVQVIKNFKESEEFLPAHYYLGKIYESSWDERDLERSLKYYQLYLNGVEGKNPKPGYDFRKETRERLRVLGSAI
ncbi:tetratricopeptide repeat protein [Leptospira biflexa]|uniref:tetratricopeptide repeat protein n=1 Tax=Leptospira biflexa TaxID=172 RepID=UPI0010848C94|nr:tetratricopeptide repeat protein [Leptospira biflexa]TGM33753.1 tetratricopeptide repeat protein [Leptospira biflexa]TGM35380.1 tetratricopeptide repeat protein [Leptospira biflexa]